jgi:hypothetical protein
MNLLDELRLHVDALVNVVDEYPKFFVSIKHYVRQLAQLLESSRERVNKDEFQLLARKIEEFYRKWRPSPSSEGVLYVPPRETSDSDLTVVEINKLITTLTELDEESFKSLFPSKQRTQPEIVEVEDRLVLSPCVFIGHGRSVLWARLKMFLEDELNLATVTYESESRVGESIVPVLEQMLDQANFAVLVLSAEDETADGSKRARQNVVHEAGLFQGRLGFKRAVLLIEGGLEGFTNVDGLQHIKFSSNNIEQAFYELQRVLKREGMLK